MSGTEQKAREHQTVPHKIISGGQTGADRAALDFALDAGIPHGGWVPRGRLAEDGPLPARYAVQEIDRRSYAARTEKNVLEADGTLILSHGKLTGGSALTRRLAKRHERPWLHLDLERIGAMDAATSLQAWIEEKGIRVLNVAGPRASQDPRIYEATRKILKTAYHLGLVAAGTRGPWSGRPDPPTTVRDAVQRLASEMTLKDRVTVSRMAERDLRALVTHHRGLLSLRDGGDPGRGVRCNIDPAHIQEEAANIRGVEADRFYERVSCETLILRAKHGLLSDRDIVMPDEVVERMVREIPRASRVDFETNHFMLVFDPIPERARAILDFLAAQ